MKKSDRKDKKKKEGKKRISGKEKEKNGKSGNGEIMVKK